MSGVLILEQWPFFNCKLGGFLLQHLVKFKIFSLNSMGLVSKYLQNWGVERGVLILRYDILSKTNMAMEHGPFQDVFHIENEMFHCHVSLLECQYNSQMFGLVVLRECYSPMTLGVLVTTTMNNQDLQGQFEGMPLWWVRKRVPRKNKKTYWDVHGTYPRHPVIPPAVWCFKF